LSSISRQADREHIHGKSEASELCSRGGRTTGEGAKNVMRSLGQLSSAEKKGKDESLAGKLEKGSCAVLEAPGLNFLGKRDHYLKKKAKHEGLNSIELPHRPNGVISLKATGKGW